MPTRGIIYVASKQAHYVEEAFLSAESIKSRHPNLPITLFTDASANALCATGYFDEVRELTPTTGLSSSWAEGQLNRLTCLSLSPYDLTLHLDTDTRLLDGDVVNLFDLLNDVDVAMVEDPVEHSYARKHSGRAMYNAGFVFYRRNEAVLSWLAQWRTSTERNFRLAEQNPLPDAPELEQVKDEAVRRELLRMDQISLMELLSPDVNRVGLNIRSLGYEWNYRGSLRGKPIPTIKIAHLQEFRARTAQDILTIAYNSSKRGRQDRANRLYDYIADRQRSSSPRKRWLRWITPPANSPEEWSTAELRNGDLHLRYGQIGEAFDIFSALLKEAPGDALGAIGLARVALASGHVEEAINIAANAAATLPSSSYAQATYGRALLAANRAHEAVVPLSVALPKAGAEGAFQLGQAWLALKQYEKAASHYAQAVEMDSQHEDAAANLLPALLGSRRYRDALMHANKILDRRPWNVRALAFKSVALVELGLREEERNLARRDTFLKLEYLAPPDGFGTMPVFNNALAQAFSSAELVYEPAGKTAKKGFQSNSLAESAHPAIRALNQLILAAVDLRRAELSGSNAHPFVSAVPRSYYFNSWAVVLDEGGHQTPHIHPSGWLSGVYYVGIPEDMTANDPAQSGWLCFGRSEERWYRHETITNDTTLCPEPGMLVTFPSYYWHSTKPLLSNCRRISYAFDIVPA